MKIHHALKHAFIPHEHNDYKPHLFREASIGIILVTSLALFTVSATSALVLNGTEAGSAMVSSVLIDLTNKDRMENNLSFLSHSSVLESAAKMKAEDMSAGAYFAHTSPAGVDPWHWFAKVGYIFLYAGENLAINFAEPTQVENAWMASPLHRANILDNRFKEIGISTAEGVYNGRLTTYVVQLFGTPAVAASTEVKKEVAVSSNKETAPSVSKAENSSEGVLSATKTDNGGSTNTVAAKKEILTPIALSPSLVAVKNNAPVEEINSSVAVTPQTYSTWYGRLLFNAGNYINIIFTIISVIIFIGLILMIVIEIEKQHPKHILYGVGTLSFLILLMYVNKEIFIQHFVFLV